MNTEQTPKLEGQIILRFNDEIRIEICAVTGNMFESGIPFAFYLETGEIEKLPVSQEAAMAHGFRISKGDLVRLKNLFLAGLKAFERD